MTFSWTPYASLSSGDVKKGIRHESSCPRSHRRARFGAGGVRANTPLEQSRLRQGKDEVGSEGWSGQERRMRCCGACEDRRQKVTTARVPSARFASRHVVSPYLCLRWPRCPHRGL